MKYTVTINQLVLSRHSTADTHDGAILDYLYYLCTSTSQAIISQRLKEDSGDWTWVNYQHLIDEMPLLRMNDKSSISKRLDKIESFGYIQCKKENQLRKKYVRLTPKFDELLIKINDPQIVVDVDQQPQAGVIDVDQRSRFPRSTNHYTNNNYTIDAGRTPAKNNSSLNANKKEIMARPEENPTLPQPSSLYTSPNYLTTLQESDIVWFMEHVPGTEEVFIRQQAERAYYWLESRGRRQKNYRAFLRNWLDDSYQKKGSSGITYEK